MVIKTKLKVWKSRWSIEGEKQRISGLFCAEGVFFVFCHKKIVLLRSDCSFQCQIQKEDSPGVKPGGAFFFHSLQRRVCLFLTTGHKQ
jgi:hypothetical protein